MIGTAVVLFSLNALVGMGAFTAYISAIRQQFPNLYAQLGQPSSLLLLGTFYLGGNTKLWKHIVIGEPAEAVLEARLLKLRRVVKWSLLFQYPLFALLMIAIFSN